MSEGISALMDDELNDAERAAELKALKADSALQTKWRNYHLIRTALRTHRVLRAQRFECPLIVSIPETPVQKKVKESKS